MVRVGWKRCTAGLAVTLLLVACSTGSDDGSAGEADDLADITVEDEEPEPEPEPEPDPEPDADEPEPEPEPDPEPADDPDGYDGFPIDQPVEDISVIDEAYVNEVLAQLEVNYHLLVNRILELGTEGFEDDQVKQASVLPDLAITAVEDLERQMVETVLLFDSESWFEPDPGPASVEVEELLTVTSNCVSAAVILNADDLYAVPLSGRWYVGIWPREVMTSEAGTIWRFATRVVDRGEVVDVCV